MFSWFGFKVAKLVARDADVEQPAVVVGLVDVVAENACGGKL